MHDLVRLRESINLLVSIELFDHEHSSPRALLLCREAWRHCGCRAQDAIWNSAAGRKRTNRQIRRSFWRKIIQSEAIFPSSRWRRAIRVHQTVFRRRREGRWQNPRRLEAIAHRRAFDCCRREKSICRSQSSTATRFQTPARSARDSITKLSTGRCRSNLGRKTVPDRATISRRSRNRSDRRKGQFETRLVLLALALHTKRPFI